MLETLKRLVPLAMVLLLVPLTASNASAAAAPAKVQVLRSAATLRDDGLVEISVRAKCDPDLAAFELDVSLTQGSALGATSIVQAGVVTCDALWHTVQVTVTPSVGTFGHGAATVDVFLGVFDQNEGDLEARASAKVRL
jgi:hypothetical protein